MLASPVVDCTHRRRPRFCLTLLVHAPWPSLVRPRETSRPCPCGPGCAQPGTLPPETTPPSPKIRPDPANATPSPFVASRAVVPTEWCRTTPPRTATTPSSRQPRPEPGTPINPSAPFTRAPKPPASLMSGSHVRSDLDVCQILEEICDCASSDCRPWASRIPPSRLTRYKAIWIACARPTGIPPVHCS